MKKTHFLLLLLSCTSLLSAGNWDRRVYLASYPRAGNHWVRYLIEEATGIATSSVYCDGQDREYQRQHLTSSFPWGFCPPNGFEGNRRYPGPDDIVVIKTHYPLIEGQSLDNRSAVRSICIVRHPIDVFFSHHQQELSPGRVPPQLLEYFITNFLRFHAHWESKPDTVFIRYEDLYNSPASVLKKIFTAAGLRAKEQDIRRALDRYKPRGGLLKHLHHFDPADVAIIKKRLHDYMQRYNYTAP